MATTNRRVSKGRSRNGCTTCKIRRVKCDEQKPACYKCVYTGRTCSGYGDSGADATIDVAMAAKSQFRILQHVPGISQRTRMWQIPQSTELLSDPEYHALEFFRFHTTLCFGSGIGDFLLRAVHHEPILRTISIALGSLHRSFVYKKGIDPAYCEETRLIFLYYNKAIRSLVSIDPKTNPRGNDTFLIACIFFFCFECLHGNFKSAFQHALSGLKIIKQEQLIANVSGVGAYMPAEKITLLFSILENQVLEIENEGILTSELRPVASSSFLHPVNNLSFNFNDIEESFVSFQFLYNRFTRFLSICDTLGDAASEHPSDPEIFEDIQSMNSEYIGIQTAISSWIAAFESWLEQSSTGGDESESATVTILKIWRIVIEIFLRLPLPFSENGWDKFIDDFSAINLLVASLIEAPSKDILCRRDSPNSSRPGETQPLIFPRVSSLPTLLPKSSSSETSMFSLSLGVVTPLYLCATRCRQSSVRYHALGLMSYCQRREGLWDSDLAARIAKRIVTIEEEAAQIPPKFDYTPANIASSCRVTSLSPAFEQSGRVKVRYNREGFHGVIEETFTW